MRPTVPDFVPERVVEAREARCMTQASLAELVSASPQAISAYEKGKSAPSPQMLHRIAQQTNFPPHRFLLPMPEDRRGPPFFRSMASATKRARARAERRLSWLRHDICGYLDRMVEFLPVEFPLFHVPDDPQQLYRGDVEKIAESLRRSWGLGEGPISDLDLLLENHGAILVRQELGANTLDAFSEVDLRSGRPFIVLGTEKASACRSRFDAAHELGHLLLHRHLRSGIVNGSETHKLLEKQAHYFATAFLLPKRTFIEDFSPSLDAIVILKSRWKVSVAAMMRRALNLGLIDEYRYKRLCANKNRRWGGTREPLDDELPYEQPRFLRRSFVLLVDEGATSRADIETALAMYSHDVETAAGLEPGFFGDDTPDSYKFPTLKARDRSGDDDGSDPFTGPSATELPPPFSLSQHVAQG